MWSQLEIALLSYNKILEQRIRGEQSVRSLDETNAELKEMLRQNLTREMAQVDVTRRSTKINILGINLKTIAYMNRSNL